MIDNIRRWLSRRQTPDVPAILVGHSCQRGRRLRANIMIGVAGHPRSVLADPPAHPRSATSTSTEPQRRLPAARALPGNIERIDCEEHEPKNSWWPRSATTDDVAVRGWLRQARPFVTVKADVRDAADPTAGRRSHQVATLRQAQGDSFDRLRGGSFDKLRAGSFDRLRGRPSGVGCAGDHQTAARTEALLIEREITRALEGAYFVTAPKDVERSSASAWARSP